MIKKEIRYPLNNTWEELEKITEQYAEQFNHPKFEKFNEYFMNMDVFERSILVLYAEYDSYRKVAEETYCSYGTVKLIMSCIRNEMKQLGVFS